MEDSVIKSPAQSSPNTSILNQNIENPTTTYQNKNDNIEIFRKDDANENIRRNSTNNTLEVQNQFDKRDKDEIFDDLKNSNKISASVTTEKKMTKPLRTRMSCRKEAAKISPDNKKTGKSTPLRNTARKILGEKQIPSIRSCNKSGIFLRSSRKKGADLLGKDSINSNTEIPDESKSKGTCKNHTDFKDASQSMVKENLSPAEENISEELGKNCDPLSLENEKDEGSKVKRRKTVPYESLSLMEKIIIRENEILKDMCKEDESTKGKSKDTVLNNEAKSTASGSTEGETRKKRYHRRKCTEPLKNERVQTRGSRSITLMQNKNEFKYSPQVSKTVKCITSETNDGSEEKMQTDESAIDRNTDINTNDRKEETILDGNRNPAIGSSDEANNLNSETNKDEDALNFANKSSADEISTCNKDDSEISVSTDSAIPSERSGCLQANEKYFQSSRKQRQENADENPKRKLRHVNAQAMPVYIGRIAAARNENRSKSLVAESLPLLQTEKKDDRSSDGEYDKADRKEEGEKEAQPFFDNVHLRGKTEKITDPKSSYLSNTDSEETLSNVESVPNSPAQEIWPKVAGNNSKLINKRAKHDSGQSSSCRRDQSLKKHEISTGVSLGIAENDGDSELEPARKRVCSETEISSTLNRTTERNDCEPRYYVETLANQDPLQIDDGSEGNAENCVGNDDLGGPRETPWLRHYERPQKIHADTAKNAAEFGDDGNRNSLQRNQNLYHQQTKHIRTTKKTGNASFADNSITENVHAAKGYTCRNSTAKPLHPVNNPPFRKRGRPRKQDTQNPEMNAEDNRRKRPYASRTSRSNGSGLTKLELERLFFKFLQDGHFRIAPGQPPIVIHNNDLYRNYSARMQCHDPRRYYTDPHNTETKSNFGHKTNPHSQRHLPTDNAGVKFNPSRNFGSGEFGNRMRTMNPNSHNFPNGSLDQTAYSRNLSPRDTNTNIRSYENSEKTVLSNSSYNAIAQPNSASRYMQSTGYSTASNEQQNFYNNANVTGNHSYSNSYSGIVNPNRSMNNINAGTAGANLPSSTNDFDDDFDFILNSQHQHRNSIPCIDLTTSSGNTVSSNPMNTMQDSPADNVNSDWSLSGIDQLDSVNGLLMDLNSMNDAIESNQAMEGTSDLNNVMNNQNSMMNGTNPWMNRSNKTVNPRFPVLPPWHGSSPMYNSRLNNGNSYYNNVFDPYAFMGSDPSRYPYTNTNSTNGMASNNQNTWMQNLLTSGDEHSTFSSTNTEFSRMNYEENLSNQGVNLSLSTNTTFPQRNSTELDDKNLEVNHSNRLNPNIEQPRDDNFARIEMNGNNAVEKSARGYADEITLPYSLEYKNDTQNFDFNDVEMMNSDKNNAGNQEQRSLTQIEDYMKQRSESLEGSGNRNYRRIGTPNCQVVAELSKNRETEMFKLRQELADFTRQYSEEQTSRTSQIPQGEEIFI